MAAEKAKYLQFPVIEKYVEDTFKGEAPNPLQAACDTIFQKILDCYFTVEDDFITETQGYPNSEEKKIKYNIAIKTIAQGQLETVLIVEAKRFPFRRTSTWKEDVTKRYWERPKEQLQQYMLEAKEKGKWDHIMYGIVMLRDRVHFHQLKPDSNKLEVYKSEVLSEVNDKATLSIRDDNLLLEKVLREILEKVKHDRESGAKD